MVVTETLDEESEFFTFLWSALNLDGVEESRTVNSKSGRVCAFFTTE